MGELRRRIYSNQTVTNSAFPPFKHDAGDVTLEGNQEVL